MKQLDRFKKALQEENHYSDYQMEVLGFYVHVFLSEGSKLLLLFVFYLCLHKVPEFLIAVATLMSVRSFTGGIHLLHYWSCLLLTFSIFFLGICVLPSLVTFTPLVMMIVLHFCIIGIYVIGPVLSIYRPPLSDEQKKSSSLKAATAVLFYTYLIFIFQENCYLYVGFWVIVLQTLQLGIAKINKICERRKVV